MNKKEIKKLLKRTSLSDKAKVRMIIEGYLYIAEQWHDSEIKLWEYLEHDECEKRMFKVSQDWKLLSKILTKIFF